MLNKPIIGYVLKSALRDRLVMSMLCTLVVGLSVSVFMGSSAVTEADQFTFVFASSALRFIGTIGIILFTVFYVRSMYERRDVEYMLSRPLSRGGFIFSHATAFMLIASIIALAVGTVMVFLTLSSSTAAIFYWCLGLWLEFMLVAVGAMFFSMVLSSPASATLATLGLYVLGRMMGNLMGIVEAGSSMPMFEILSFTMQVVSIIVPRFDLLVQSGWLVYGDAYIPAALLGQSASLLGLYSVSAWLDLRRKQF